MLQFVKKWMREMGEEKVIIEDGTREKWTKCEDGLPHSDRYVEVFLYGLHNSRVSDKQPHISTGKFNPRVGWDLEGSIGIVIAWRDLDEGIKDMMNDFNFLKKISQK